MSTLAYLVNYDKSPRASTDSRRTSTSTSGNDKKFTMKAALEQLKPTEEQITPSGIYAPIIKRGSLFNFRRSSKSSSSDRKHSQTQAHVDAALLR